MLPPAPPLTRLNVGSLAEDILKGNLIVFLGAGASLSSPLPGKPNCTLPSASRLSRILLAQLYRDPGYKQEINRCIHLQLSSNLSLAAQYCASVADEDWVYNKLTSVFTGDYQPTDLHRALASVTKRQERHSPKYPRHAPLVLTTNYDMIVEKALSEIGQCFDQIVYRSTPFTLPDGELDRKGYFLRTKSDFDPVAGKWSTSRTVIEDPAKDTGISVTGDVYEHLHTRPVLLKIHGSRHDSNALASYIITQDHYIRYLSQMNAKSFLPAQLINILRNHRYLFLGYSLTDSNVHAQLSQFWDLQPVQTRHYAIRRNPTAVEVQLWKQRGVDIYNGDLNDFGADLLRELQSRAPLP
ncbi:MAG: SIR2 family protein [Verrucomicrobiota bacterium]